MPAKTTQVTDPFAHLEAEHRQVEGYFANLSDTTERAEVTRKEEFDKLNEALSLHAEMEEKILYPALEELKTTHEIALEAFEEHHVAKMLLKELAAMPKDTEEWKAKLTVLEENIKHHVKEEEGDMFIKGRKALKEEQQQAMAEAMTDFLEKRA